MKNIKYFITFLAAIIILVTGLVVVKYAQENQQQCANPTEAGCPDTSLRRTTRIEFKEATSYFISDTGGFECSRPIKLQSNTLTKDGTHTNFRPVDQDEANLFCHMTTAIEYKGKITVLQKQEVLDLIKNYDYKDVTIKALEFEYIEDKDFVHRLLPTYKDREIGCIIILETPNEKLVYLEDEKLETFEKLDYQTFLQYLGAASPADRELFTKNLQ